MIYESTSAYLRWNKITVKTINKIWSFDIFYICMYKSFDDLRINKRL